MLGTPRSIEVPNFQEFKHPHLPAAKSSSSLRVVAAAAASTHISLQSSNCTLDNRTRRSRRKQLRHKQHLIKISVPQDFAANFSDQDWHVHFLFADGGAGNNPKIVPPVFEDRPNLLLNVT